MILRDPMERLANDPAGTRSLTLRIAVPDLDMDVRGVLAQDGSGVVLLLRRVEAALRAAAEPLRLSQIPDRDVLGKVLCAWRERRPRR